MGELVTSGVAPSGPLVDILSNWFIWFVIGSAVLYFVCSWAKRLMDLAMPSLLMIAICVLVGGVVVASISRLL